MFLTTNRVTQFDVAILSRIHVTVPQHDLSKDAGKKVWALFIETANRSRGEARISDAELQLLISSKLHGRQVRNSYSTSRHLGLQSTVDQECHGYSTGLS
jgi:hypothetical protein